jgi:hypothetical protein
MPEHVDSLDIVELAMAMEAIESDPGIPPHQREQLIRDIAAQIARCEDDPGLGAERGVAAVGS